MFFVLLFNKSLSVHVINIFWYLILTLSKKMNAECFKSLFIFQQFSTNYPSWKLNY